MSERLQLLRHHRQSLARTLAWIDEEIERVAAVESVATPETESPEDEKVQPVEAVHHQEDAPASVPEPNAAVPIAADGLLAGETGTPYVASPAQSARTGCLVIFIVVIVSFLITIFGLPWLFYRS